MKSLFLISTLAIVFIACAQTGEHANQDPEDEQTDDPNQALYDQVMEVHNEVMPKMDDLYHLKQQLSDRLANTTGMPEDKKKEFQETIARLDSANDAMMDWMHKFNPLPDTVDTELAREYLETEMERIKKVRDLTNETLAKAKAVAGKN